ncbi:MAG: hypothetical protein M1829_002393 [Trizodia sp. TS-e1964]|nr:MAG: hypothetical protein M1829_002393 [Trizodia sp. TS-e1964]
MASSKTLHNNLLRPPILHILRAAGFHSTRPSVLDTFVDLAARYLLLLAQSTASMAALNHNTTEISIEDIRMAMQDCGAFSPQTSVTEEVFSGAEDMRGVENFVQWFSSDACKEIRRIAGLLPPPGMPANFVGMDKPEDYLTTLRKKHSKTGDEVKFQGTVIGIPAADRRIFVEGGDADSIAGWRESQRHASRSAPGTPGVKERPALPTRTSAE